MCQHPFNRYVAVFVTLCSVASATKVLAQVNFGFPDSRLRRDADRVGIRFGFEDSQRRASGRPASAFRLELPWNGESFDNFIEYCERHGIQYKLSLKRLAADCRRAQARTGRIPPTLRHLRGFTWFFGFVIDRENGDVILLGIRDPNRPVIDVDCVVTAIKAVYSGKTPACSLDAHPNPKWQKSVIRGVAWNTRWAEIMIEADYLMKRICQGRVDPKISGMSSWTEKRADIIRSGRRLERQLNRWWFNRPKREVPRSLILDDDLVIIYKNPVVLLTEQAVGGKFGTGTIAEEAQHFARAFTQNMTLLGYRYQSIGELLGLYRLLDIFVHLRSIGQVAPPEPEFWCKTYRHPYGGPPEVFPTLTTTVEGVKDDRGKVWEISVFGGVEMPPKLQRSLVTVDRTDRSRLVALR